MLSLYLESESRRWAAQQQQSYPTSPSLEDDASSLSDCEESDTESIFSRGNRSSSRSRRSSISSVASDDEGEGAGPAAFDQPRDFSGAPIAIYTSLDQAVAQSTQRVEAEGAPRRLVTPGKLYENEEDDDEIVEADEGEQLQHSAHVWSGYTTTITTTPSVLAVG
ncbi:hypothetical protein F4820DRAFT_207228 [Hypoxylon rubiginosum]|uniref:Uncharacterized protein n=1 Tax=Hypoxylon rubiginosum TaxID=110542 RepID=A0ACB9Z666_9PEZI|nr:hypothetical protein F4820DRAFT_207228 [Hypoxylon rubiginosum]